MLIDAARCGKKIEKQVIILRIARQINITSMTENVNIKIAAEYRRQINY